MKSTLEVNAEERKFLTIFLVQNGGIRFIIQKFTNEQDLSLLNSIEAISSIQFAIYWNTIKPVKILIYDIIVKDNQLKAVQIPVKFRY